MNTPSNQWRDRVPTLLHHKRIKMESDQLSCLQNWSPALHAPVVTGCSFSLQLPGQHTSCHNTMAAAAAAAAAGLTSATASAEASTPPDLAFDCLVFDLAFHPSQDLLAVGLVDGRVDVYVLHYQLRLQRAATTQSPLAPAAGSRMATALPSAIAIAPAKTLTLPVCGPSVIPTMAPVRTARNWLPTRW